MHTAISQHAASATKKSAALNLSLAKITIAPITGKKLEHLLDTAAKPLLCALSAHPNSGKLDANSNAPISGFSVCSSLSVLAVIMLTNSCEKQFLINDQSFI